MLLGYSIVKDSFWSIWLSEKVFFRNSHKVLRPWQANTYSMLSFQLHFTPPRIYSFFLENSSCYRVDKVQVGAVTTQLYRNHRLVCNFYIWLQCSKSITAAARWVSLHTHFRLLQFLVWLFWLVYFSMKWLVDFLQKRSAWFEITHLFSKSVCDTNFPFPTIQFLITV